MSEYFKLLHEEKSYLQVLKEATKLSKGSKKINEVKEEDDKEKGEEKDEVEELDIHQPDRGTRGGFGSIGGKDTRGGFGSIAGRPRGGTSESEKIEEKWAKDVKVQSTGQHAGKSIEQLKAEINKLKGKPGNKEKMGELLFALRSKQGWKKKTGL